MGDDSHSDTVEVKGDWRAFRYARNPRRVAKRPARNDRFPDTFPLFSYVVNSQDAARGARARARARSESDASIANLTYRSP